MIGPLSSEISPNLALAYFLWYSIFSSFFNIMSVTGWFYKFFHDFDNFTFYNMKFCIKLLLKMIILKILETQLITIQMKKQINYQIKRKEIPERMVMKILLM